MDFFFHYTYNCLHIINKNRINYSDRFDTSPPEKEIALNLMGPISSFLHGLFDKPNQKHIFQIRVFPARPHVHLKSCRLPSVLAPALTCTDCTWKTLWRKRWQVSYSHVVGNLDAGDLLLKRGTARMKGGIKINEAFQRQQEKPAP